MKKIKNIIYISLLMSIIFSVCLSNSVYAEDTPAAGTSIMDSINTMAANTEDKTGGAIQSAKNISGAVVTIAKTVSAGIAIIMITVLAMKYMLAAPSEKADIKKHAIPYVVGAIIMFPVSGILSILQNFAGVFD